MRPSTMASRRQVCRSEGQPRTTLPRRRRRCPRRHSPARRRLPASTPRVSEPSPAKRAPNLLHRDQEATRKPRLPFRSPSTYPYNRWKYRQQKLVDKIDKNLRIINSLRTFCKLT